MSIIFFRLHKLHFDASLLPEIVPVNSIAGNLRMLLHGMELETVVYTAYGDMQCSIRAARPLKCEAGIVKSLFFRFYRFGTFLLKSKRSNSTK